MSESQKNTKFKTKLFGEKIKRAFIRLKVISIMVTKQLRELRKPFFKSNWNIMNDLLLQAHYFVKYLLPLQINSIHALNLLLYRAARIETNGDQ